MASMPCLGCGQLSKSSRCHECQAAVNRRRGRDQLTPRTPTRARGYDHNWDKLSKRARQLQPFCSDCGTPYDLQGDHTPAAWRRKEQGLPIRLQDIDVVCGKHNRERGAARGENVQR